MSDPLEIALEAREAARTAHYRLDRMNGSLDRLVKSVDDLGVKIVAVQLTLASKQGGESVSKTFLDSKRWWIALLVGVATSAAFAAIITLVLRGHP